MDWTKIPFIGCKPGNYIECLPGERSIQVIVIHSMEAPEKGNTAESVARYFNTGAGGRKASVHYCIDNNSVVQTLQTKDVAFGAKGMNRNGIHLEHAGYARQSSKDWLDLYSYSMLQLSANLCAKVLCPKFLIPAKILTLDEVRRSRTDKSIKGFCTHAMITKAFDIKGGHTDPGKGFPFEFYISLIDRFLNKR